MKASIDRDLCIGCELCTAMCPEVFEMDDQQIATVIVNPIPEAVLDAANQAKDSCPTSAITIE